MAVNLEEKVDTLEEVLRRFISHTEQMLARMDRRDELLQKEMQDFKNEMSDFKDEMSDFKNEMSDFKNEMQRFKEEMRQETIKLNKRLAEISDRQGLLAESVVAPSVPRIVREYFHLEVDGHGINLERRKPDGREKEYDVVTTAGDLVFVTSVKTTLRNKHVNEFKEDLAEFREFFPEYRDKKLIGILAALTIKPAQLKYAERQGFLVLGVGEDIMEVKNREGFEPKIW